MLVIFLFHKIQNDSESYNICSILNDSGVPHVTDIIRFGANCFAVIHDTLETFYRQTADISVDIEDGMGEFMSKREAHCSQLKSSVECTNKWKAEAHRHPSLFGRFGEKVIHFVSRPLQALNIRRYAITDSQKLPWVKYAFLRSQQDRSAVLSQPPTGVVLFWLPVRTDPFENIRTTVSPWRRYYRRRGGHTSDIGLHWRIKYNADEIECKLIILLFTELVSNLLRTCF